MLSSLRVSLIQADTHWHNANANRSMYGDLITSLKGQTDLIVLPETLTSGFSNQVQIHNEESLKADVHWLQTLAKKTETVITGSIVACVEQRYFNRLYWVRPDGSYSHYDKKHLFRYAGEHERYTAGSQRLIVDLKGWRICPLICYDLRFPVFARNCYRSSELSNASTHTQTHEHKLDYDLLVVVANWPAARQYAWQTLLRARAIENLSYVIGVNRVGIDGNQLHYAGGSVVLDPLGQAVVECGAQAQIMTTELNADTLHTHRARYPFYLDADRFEMV
jgi:omega-amidase